MFDLHTYSARSTWLACILLIASMHAYEVKKKKKKKHTGKGVKALMMKLVRVQNYATRWTVSAFKTTPSDACSFFFFFFFFDVCIIFITDAKDK
jgi:hypothetical protein